METTAGFWDEIYVSPIGSVPVEDLYLNVNYVPKNDFGLSELSFHSLDAASTEYFMYLGNGTDQGVYHPEFVSIDPDSVVVTIDGTEAVMIGRDDNSSVLAANTYSVYPYAGVIRFSIDDAGKPVTATYVTLVNE